MQSRKEKRALAAILDRAAIDLAFRQRLLVDPRAAIFECFDVLIPESFRIKFIERDADLDALIVLPDVKSSTGELSDDDLDTVAGGVTETPEWSDGIDDGEQG